MPQQKTTSRQRFSQWPRLTAIGLGALIVLFVVQQASAGPITGVGGPPFAKLSVYQGLISIVTNQPGDSVMEIGNAGRDIKSTGSITILPQNTALGSGADTSAEFYWGSAKTNLRVPGSICFGAIGTTDCKSTWVGLGGGSQNLDQVLTVGDSSNHQIALTDHGSAPDFDQDTKWFTPLGVSRNSDPTKNNVYIGFTKTGVLNWGIGISSTSDLVFGNPDTSLNNGPTHPIANPALRLTTAGDLTALGAVKGSSLCIAADCRNAWPEGLLPQGLDEVLGVGNTSNKNIGLSDDPFMTPLSNLVINKNLGTKDEGNANDGIHVTVNSPYPSSAIYAEQKDITGYSGYFNGGLFRVIGSTDIIGNTVITSTDYNPALTATNPGSGDPAALFNGVVSISGTPHQSSSGGNPIFSDVGAGALSVRANSYSSGGPWGVGIVAEGGVIYGNVTSSAGLYASVPADNANSYAAFFVGRVTKKRVTGNDMKMTTIPEVATYVVTTDSTNTCVKACANDSQSNMDCVLSWDTSGPATESACPTVAPVPGRRCLCI